MSKVILFTHPIMEHISVNRGYKWCNNLRSFKKQIKPYGDPDSIVMPWNDGEHARKFIECKCDIVDGNNNVSQVKRQRIWGEWEQPSRVFKIETDAKEPMMANYVHLPLFGKLENTAGNEKYMNYQNTDPYLFGDAFYYCCCKQLANNTRANLISLEEDDIIIFGGLLGTAESGYKYAIDTIFVVDSAVCKYGTQDTSEESKDIIAGLNGKYVHGVLNTVLYGNDESLGRDVKNYFVLYKAKMYKTNSEDIFSFFPVKKEDNYKKVEISYEKMQEILHIKQTGKKILNRSQASCHELNTQDVWSELQKYIVDEKGYLMGVKAYDEFDEYVIKS